MSAQQTGFPGGAGQAQQQRPMATGFQPSMGQMPGMQGMQGMQTGLQTGMQTGAGGPPSAGTGQYSFLNAPPAAGSFGRQNSTGGMAPQMTGYPGGSMMPQQTGYSGLMSQQTGMHGGGLMAQQTGMPGLMSQPTGMGLRAQPTGIQDPRLGAMMQTFMPSNLSQVGNREIKLMTAIFLSRSSSIQPRPAPDADLSVSPPESGQEYTESSLGTLSSREEGL